VIDLAGTVFAVQNTYSDAALAAYRDESREMLRAPPGASSPTCSSAGVTAAAGSL
jgi:peroxiredoxin